MKDRAAIVTRTIEHFVRIAFEAALAEALREIESVLANELAETKREACNDLVTKVFDD
jgi:uncharacterized membrane protein